MPALYSYVVSTGTSNNLHPNVSSISRSGATFAGLANEKKLKPSLKYSVSSPQITDWRAQHPPSTPLIPKNVHFPERNDNLENVVLFDKTARPSAVSGNVEDSETEAEGYDSPTNSAALAGNNNRFPSLENQFDLEIDTEQSSVVPVIDPNVFSNVHVETLVFPRTRPPTLRGSILVKNVAFEKSVALRFTLDNWQTTSEVVCRHVCTLPSLPSPFPPERISLGSPQLTWDRFSFMVRLEDAERKLAELTIFFAARFMAVGIGEWLDDNSGANYKVVFKKAVSSAGPFTSKSPSPLRFADGPSKMFPGLDLRPSTMSLPPTDSDMPPLRLKRPFSQFSSPLKFAPSPATTLHVAGAVAPPPTSAATCLQVNITNSPIASTGSSGSLRLSNYMSNSSTASGRSLAGAILEEQLLRRNIGGLGQFQAIPIKPLAPFLTVAYILAQRILGMARSSKIFCMQKVHIARQAMHLVILFNDSLDVNQGLSDEQEEERIDLEDELRDFERIIKRLDDVAQVEPDDSPTLHKFHQEFFRWRPYFVNARDVKADLIYPKLEAYDLRTLEIMQCQASNSKVASVSAAPHQRNMSNSSIGLSGKSGSLRLSNYASPTSPVQISTGNSNRNSTGTTLGPIIGGHPISLGPSSLGRPDPRGDSDVRKRPLTSALVSNTTLSTNPTSLGAPFTPASADRTPSPSSFTNAEANGSSYPSSTADSTYAALVEKWCFHQSPPPSEDASPALEMTAPNHGVSNKSRNKRGVSGAFESGAARYGLGYG